MRRLIVGLVILASILVGGASPASADHEWHPARWNRAPAVGYDGWNVGNVQDAAYFWQDRGFDGYIPPLPLWNGNGAGCATIYDGWIIGCTVSRATLQMYCSQDCDGTAYVATNNLGYILGAWILVSNDLDNVRRQQVWRHEWGHAIGLGHTAGTNCVMYHTAPILGETCWHDAVTVSNVMYPGRRF